MYARSIYLEITGLLKLLFNLCCKGFIAKAANKSLQALTWAARHGHKKIVFKLLELGADKSVQTKDGQTPGDIAKNNKHSEVLVNVGCQDLG